MRNRIPRDRDAFDQMKADFCAQNENTLDLLYGEIERLRRRVREADERASARVLLTIDEAVQGEHISKQHADRISFLFNQNFGFDALEQQREVARKAQRELEQLREVFEAADRFRAAVDRYEDAQHRLEHSLVGSSPSSVERANRDVQETRQDLFTLLDELSGKVAVSASAIHNADTHV